MSLLYRRSFRPNEVPLWAGPTDLKLDQTSNHTSLSNKDLQGFPYTSRCRALSDAEQRPFAVRSCGLMHVATQLPSMKDS